MIKKLKLMILSLSYLFALAFPVAALAGTTYAATPAETKTIQGNLCQGSNLNLDQNDNGCSDSNISGAGTSATSFIAKVINILSVIIGAIAVVMIIIGGFRYVTSGGNAESTKSARQTIVYAIVGLIIVALAQIIVHFVLNSVSSA
jgi:cytochrome bd-type quinol oxidase subunit 2